MIKLVSARNVDQVLLEFKEYVAFACSFASCTKLIRVVNRYAQDVDQMFARCAIRAISRTAIKLQAVAEKCVKALLQLIRRSKKEESNYESNFVVQVCAFLVPLAGRPPSSRCCHACAGGDCGDEGRISALSESVREYHWAPVREFGLAR